MNQGVFMQTKMAVFGDSIAKGIFLPQGGKRYQVLKDGLGNFFGQYNVSVDNFSMMGSTISKGLSVLRQHSRDLSGYRNVFLEFGGNDCDYRWAEVSQRPREHHDPKTPVSEFITSYEDAINEIRKQGGHPVMLTLPPLCADRYFRWISRGLNPDHILKWLGSTDTIYRWQELYNLKCVFLANRMGVELVDIRSGFLANPNYGDLICEDGIHPNQMGYQLIYETVASQFAGRDLSVV